MKTHDQIPQGELIEVGTANLSRVIAIDSQSDRHSSTIPSTEGQRRLSEDLRRYFESLGYPGEIDENANLLVEIPPSEGFESAPAIAFMIHIDTARGTEAVAELDRVDNWDGSPLTYPANERLEVSVERYPETGAFLGEDLLFGPGRRPIGLDDKLGLAEMMTMAHFLAKLKDWPHGPIVLGCRSDEEIGRMESVVGLAENLAERGVRYGYTIDGIAPFEVQLENFNASRADITFAGETVAREGMRMVCFQVEGCKAHGATAKAEGYLNATTIIARLMTALGESAGIVPAAFKTDPASEVDAQVGFWVGSDAEEERILSELERITAPHAWRGAHIQKLDEGELTPNTGLVDAVAFVQKFLNSDGPGPILSEESDGREGYSNPYDLVTTANGARLEVRIRSFDERELEARQEHVREVARSYESASVEIQSQYVNMSKVLFKYPELRDWAVKAGKDLGLAVKETAIRGGTGVDPFLDRGIPVANLGTGYFAPESAKELTSRQKIAQHSAWLLQLVQVIAEQRG